MTPPREPQLLRYSELLASGAGRRALYTGAFIKVHHDLYVEAGADQSDPDLRMRIAAHIAGSRAHLGGWAAARCYERHALRELGTPDALRHFDGTIPWPDSTRGPAPVLLCMNRDAKVRKVDGIRPLRSDLDESDLLELDGFSITSPVRTVFDLARTEPLWRAVAAGDRLVYLGVTGVDELRTFARVMENRRGIKRATAALRLVRERVESPMETLTRLMWIEARLPMPEVNTEIHDDDGAHVARVDLLDRASRLVGEYDGDHHGTPGQRRRDAERRERLEELGYTMVTVTAPDVATPESRRRLRERMVQRYWHARRRTGL